MIRVVVVEQSIPDRDHLVRALEADGDIRVVGQAGRTKHAIDLVEAERPDVVALDLQLEGEGGKQVIEHVMAFNPTPILVLSRGVGGPESQAAVEALVAGAVDALPLPTETDPRTDQKLRERVRILQGVAV